MCGSTVCTSTSLCSFTSLLKHKEYCGIFVPTSRLESGEHFYTSNKRQGWEQAETSHPSLAWTLVVYLEKRCSLSLQKLTSPKHSRERFFAQVSQGNQDYTITTCTPCPAPPASLESFGINRSRELPTTWILMALSLALAPLEASKTILSAVSSSQLVPRHTASSRLSRARREPSLARRQLGHLPRTSMLESLRKPHIMPRGRVEEREEQIIDQFW